MGRRPQKQKPERPLFYDPRWRKCYEHFLAAKKKKSLATYQRCRGFLREFFTDPRKTPPKYTQSDIFDFIDAPTHGTSKRGTEPMPGTRNNRLKTLRSFYRFAAHYGMRTGDPTAHIEMLSTTQRPKAMRLEDVRAFFSVIPDTVQGKRDKCLFQFYLFTGRRLSELLRLQWGDIERRQQSWMYFYTAKGHGDQRFHAELPAHVHAAMLDYLTAARRTPLAPGDYVFVTLHKGYEQDAHLCTASVDYLFRRYAKLAGIAGKGYSVHSLRHTCARDRWEEMPEKDLIKLMRFMGWSSPQNAMTYLSSLTYETDDMAEKMVAKYGEL